MVQMGHVAFTTGKEQLVVHFQFLRTVHFIYVSTVEAYLCKSCQPKNPSFELNLTVFLLS